MLHKAIYTVLFFATVAIASYAQSGANSPYSRFGIGDLTDNNFMFSRQMGGMGASYADPYYINIVNPASYAYLKATAFEVGVYARRSNLVEDDQEQRIFSGNLEYISLAFPLTNPINEVIEGKKKDYYVGMAFTLMPNSTVSYNVFADQTLPDIGEVTQNYTGNGGSYKFLWGNSINYKDFAFGFNLGYLFGDIRYEQNTFFTDQPAAYFNNFSTEYTMRGFLYDVGLMYNTILNKAELQDNNGALVKRLSIGLHANSNTSFSTVTDASLTTIFGGSTAIADSTETRLGVEGNGTLPTEIGFGAFYQNGTKAGIGFDLSTTFWNNYRNDAETISDATPVELSDTYKVSVGGYYRPSTKSYEKYYKRIYYRYGLFYNTDPRNQGGDNITNYGLSFGMGLPLVYQRKVSHLNLGLDIGRRGTDTPVEENYIQLNFSFTFNDDEWFIKRKYN